MNGLEWLYASLLFLILGSGLIGYWIGYQRGESEEQGIWLPRVLALRQTIVVHMEVTGEKSIPGAAIRAVLESWVDDDQTALMAMLSLDTLNGRDHSKDKEHWEPPPDADDPSLPGPGPMA